MTTREHAIRNFNPHVRGDYTYQELLAAKAAGKEVPAHWITEAYAQELAAEQHAQARAAIAADLKAQEDAHAAKIKANYDKHAPALKAKLTELDTLREAEAPAQEAAREAVKAYFATVRASEIKYGEISRLIREEFGETLKGDDGNPLPGQTGLDNMNRPMFDGEPVHRPGLPHPWFDNVFQNHYFR